MEFTVIERGRTTGWIYAVSNPIPFNAAEALAYFLRDLSKIGGHDVTCYFVIPTERLAAMMAYPLSTRFG